MALRSIINFGEVIDLAIGINIHFFSDGRKEISFCIVKLRNDVLSVIENGSGLKQIEEIDLHIKNLLKKGVRMHINISGKPVLLRIVQDELREGTIEDYSKWFPGIKEEEFIVQRSVNQNASFFSLLRKEDALRETGLLNSQAHSISLGINILEAILPFLTLESIYLSGYEVAVKNACIFNINTSERGSKNEFEISGANIHSDCLLAYACAVHLFLPVKSVEISGLPEALEHAPRYYETKKSLFLTGRIVLLIVLIVLTVRTSFFFWLNQEVTEAEVNLSFSQGKNKKDSQAQRVNLQMGNTYGNMGWSINRIPLFYADQLAQSVPDGIQLNVLEVGVLNESVLRKDKRYAFNPNQIKIIGISADASALTKWILSLQKVSWIKATGEQKYQYDIRQKKGVFEFTIDTNTE